MDLLYLLDISRKEKKMSLKHDFRIVDTCYGEEFSNTDIISICDDLIQYMKDSLFWIKTLWNGKKETQGLNYYGYTIITGENIAKLRNVINAWICLFENSEEYIMLTENYLVDEDKYEKIMLNKVEILAQLEAFKKMCEKAEREEKHILHEGI